jgi:hypothetical protein
MTHIIVHNHLPKRRTVDQPTLGRLSPGMPPQNRDTEDVPGSGPYTFESKTKQEGWGKSHHASQEVVKDAKKKKKRRIK